MNQRFKLRLSGVALAWSLDGCLVSELDTSNKVIASQIELGDQLDREIDVGGLLRDDGTAKYWCMVTVPSSPDPFAMFPDLPENPRAYTMYAQTPATTADTQVEVNLVEDAGDLSCITVSMEITQAETAGDRYPSVTYGFIGECQESH